MTNSTLILAAAAAALLLGAISASAADRDVTAQAGIVLAAAQESVEASKEETKGREGEQGGTNEDRENGNT